MQRTEAAELSVSLGAKLGQILKKNNDRLIDKDKAPLIAHRLFHY